MEPIQELSQLCDSEHSILEPICILNPANELITKHYEMDQKPILKLMKLDKTELGTCYQFRNQLKNMFSTDDTLGFHYSSSFSSNVVYLKFNNQNYMKFKNKQNFLSGFFLPVEKLVSPEVKISKNIYKTLNDIEFVDYKSKIQDSFGSNSNFNSTRTARFSSNYESANLFMAMKKKHFEYDLILQNDINSKGNTQWFNFAVEFNQQGTYRFKILNFTKSYSQFEDGMKICCLSFKDQETGLGGWYRGCQNILYQESYVKREDSCYKKYYCLSFQYVCKYPTDKVVFSYFYPYTGLDLEKYLKKIMCRKMSTFVKIDKIKVCDSLSGLPIYAILIRHKRNHRQEKLSLQIKNQGSPRLNKTVVIMSRQHPGESQGSFVTEGFIQGLMENGEFENMKKSIDFLIFPMINTDGVLYGNYRTNISGADLNRVWRVPKKQLHPQVYYTKKYLQVYNKSAPISLIIDLHGHSKSYNSFFYGNPPKKDLVPGSLEDPQLFPYFCSKKIKQISFTQSTFSITEDKNNSARVVLSELFPKAHVYTLENSFHGWRRERGSFIHDYTPEVLRKIGKDILLTYFEFERVCEKNPQITQKWAKQINLLKQRVSYKKCQGEDKGDSDSEADFELIDLEVPQKTFENETVIERSIFENDSDESKLLKRQVKQNFIQRNILLRCRTYNKLNKYKNTKKFSKQNIPKQKQQKDVNIISPSSSSGFLSIVKIKAPADSQEISQSLETYEDRKIKVQGFTKDNVIDQLKRKKIKIEEAMTSCSSIKSFLRTMGIPLEKKNFF